MNLKESFRYQSFLDAMMRTATLSVGEREHCLTATKTHLRKNANPDAEDMTEVVESEAVFYPNDDVIAFMVWLVGEREKLTKAIGNAKASIGFDVDAAVETNKFRQAVNAAIKRMTRYTATKSTERGTDYKFNNEGNQAPYYYDIEVSYKEAYDRDNAKKVMRSMISEADKTSAEIDSAMINTTVDYTPVYDVNESFDDVMEEFVKRNKTTE